MCQMMALVYGSIVKGHDDEFCELIFAKAVGQSLKAFGQWVVMNDGVS